MLQIGVVFTLLIAACFIAATIFGRRLRVKKGALDGIRQGYDSLSGKVRRLGNENLKLSNILHETVGLYDIARQLCQTLDSKKIFNIFKEHLYKSVAIRECFFLKIKELPAKFAKYDQHPIVINNQTAAFLLIAGLKPQDSEKAQILIRQFQLAIRRAFLYEQVQALTVTDTLTQVYNRRYFLQKLEEEIERARKTKSFFSYLMLDVDRFKEHNDNYGHLVGDVILREVALAIKENVRQVDFAGRYGGEELAIVLSGTGRNDALAVGERIRQAIAGKTIKAYDEQIKVTASIGVAVFPDHASSAQPLIDCADQALYLAKAGGRNKICAYGDNL